MATCEYKSWREVGINIVFRMLSRYTYLVFVCHAVLLKSVASIWPLCSDSQQCPDPATTTCSYRNGCMSCTCPQGTLCNPPVCTSNCPYGTMTVRGQDGCDMCQCRPNSVTQFPNTGTWTPQTAGQNIGSWGGQNTGSMGGQNPGSWGGQNPSSFGDQNPMSWVGQAGCGSPVCPASCPQGTIRQRDQYGCEKCVCQNAYSPNQNIGSWGSQTGCAAPACPTYCQHGTTKERDQFGCERCKCRLPYCLDSPTCSNPSASQCSERNGCLFCVCLNTNPPNIGNWGVPLRQCSPPTCPINCPYGTTNGRDQNGCDVCKCRLPLCTDSQVCPDPPGAQCSERNGCLFCICNTAQSQTQGVGNWGTPVNSQCPFPTCPRNCPYGTTKERDVRGCEACICTPLPTCPPRPACTENVECAVGIQKVNGCTSPTCVCNLPTCPALQCNVTRCPQDLGFAQDMDGYACPTCECKRAEDPVVCPVLPCHAQTRCPPGVELQKERGCPVCICASPPLGCQPVDCRWAYCPFGFAKTVNGCPTCQCKPAPIQCPYLQCTRKRCRRGFDKDAQGCPTCNCTPRNRYTRTRSTTRV